MPSLQMSDFLRKKNECHAPVANLSTPPIAVFTNHINMFVGFETKIARFGCRKWIDCNVIHAGGRRFADRLKMNAVFKISSKFKRTVSASSFSVS
jgi:hypothetical protein